MKHDQNSGLGHSGQENRNEKEIYPLDSRTVRHGNLDCEQRQWYNHIQNQLSLNQRELENQNNIIAKTHNEAIDKINIDLNKIWQIPLQSKRNCKKCIKAPSSNKFSFDLIYKYFRKLRNIIDFR